MIFENGLWNLKEVCIMFKATHIIKDGVRYTIPEEWRSQYD